MRLVLFFDSLKRGKMLEIVLYFIVHYFFQTLRQVSAFLPPSPLSLATGRAAGNANSFYGKRRVLILALQSPLEINNSKK